jgi:hypothetical protein
MELIKVTKGGSLHFKLSDGRLGVTYPSGYVRVSTKRKTELIPLQRDRINFLFEFNNNNCK